MENNISTDHSSSSTSVNKRKTLKIIGVFLAFVIVMLALFLWYGYYLEEQNQEKNRTNENAEELRTESKQEIISDIRNDYSIINENIDSYSKIEKDILGESTEGGLAIYYLKDNDIENLKKISATYFGETGKSIYEFYYEESRLFFVFEQRYEYNRPIYWDKERAEEFNDSEVFDIDKSKITENRYYFYDDKLVMWLNPDQQEVETSLDSFEEKRVDVLNHSRKLIEKL
jgi:hypothetical protein